MRFAPLNMRINRMNEIFTREDLDLNDIYAASFQGRDKERFVFLWTAVSKILSTLPPSSQLIKSTGAN
jgi:hypothetical protein